MIIDERLTTYLNSLGSENTPLLHEIEQEALSQQVPIIRKDMQNLLKFLMAVHQPKTILEVGTAVGFSALLMCEYDTQLEELTTIEKYEKRFDQARDNFARAGREKQICFLTGDAMEILPTLDQTYDFIFMDAAKGQYIRFLPDVIERMHPGSLLVTDNVLQDRDILESRFAVERRNRTIHKRMREYLYVITHHEELTSTILPIGDGVALSVKR